MVQKLQQTLRDSVVARWAVLILVASMMFFAYMMADILSPLEQLIELPFSEGGLFGWTSTNYGTFLMGEYIVNVLGFLLIAGYILDKKGVRFAGTMSASMMVIGAAVMMYALSDSFRSTAFHDWLGTWMTGMPATCKLSFVGFAIFGCGCEMAGTTVSRILAKWFKGKEMALAMGIEMAIARLGVTATMLVIPRISNYYDHSIFAPVAFGTLLLLIGLINYLVFCVMDTKFDKQLVAVGEKTAEIDPTEEFHVSDLFAIFTNKMFWIVSMLCVLFYSGIFPFQKYAVRFLSETIMVNGEYLTRDAAADMFAFFPFLAMALTPFLGAFIDFKGKGATMLIGGSLIMLFCHLCFAFVLPLYPYKWLATTLIVILGVSFSLVPAALWPSVPKIIDEKVLGSAYCLIFWVQNIGLALVPLLIGWVIDKTQGFKVAMLIFAAFGLLALLCTFLLKVEDKRKGYGLELPNKK